VVIAHVCHTPHDTCATSAPPSAALRREKKKEKKGIHEITQGQNITN
jgi:hypothetical protein